MSLYGYLRAWFEEAAAREPGLPEAMALATVDPEGLPNVRMVLMKGFDERGFVFYTNIDSAKGQELDATHKARPAVSLEVAQPAGAAARPGRAGDATPRPTPISRPAPAWPRSAPGRASSRRRSKAAWRSRRRSRLRRRSSRLERFQGRRTGPATACCPLSMEFWHDRPYRLHDRIEFRRAHGWRTLEQDAALPVS